MGIQTYFGLQGKVALVTGGGRGLGQGMAEALGEAGCAVVVCSRKEENCKEAASKLKEMGVRAAGFRCDVTDPSEVAQLKDKILGEFGRIDILVNNSGATWGAPCEEYPFDGWKKVINVNVHGTFLCSQVIGKAMIEQGGGKIINISSVFGSAGCGPEIMDAIAYNTSKGAIDAFTRDLAVKWARYRINVNAIAPAFIETDMTRGTIKEHGANIIAHTPLGRFGSLDDLKGVLIFLSSRASDYVTGTVLFVDGGYRAM